MSTPTPTPGTAPFTAGSPQDIAQQQAAYQTQMTQDIQNKATGANNQFDWLATPLEWAGAKLYSVYSNYVSRPITTALLASGDLQANHQGSIFSGDTWDRAWADAKHVSPGQVLYANFVKDPTGNEKFETGQNTDGTLIWDHPDQVASYYNHGIQGWVSGGMDAAFSWYADPAVLAGKAIKAGKAVGYVRPAVETTNQTMIGAATSGALGVTGKLLGATPEGVNAAQAAFDGRRFANNIQKNLDGSVFTKFGDYIEANKARLGDSFPVWAANQKWALQGGDASGIASAFHAATTRDDINDILKIAIGDQSGIESLQARNAELGAQMQTLQSQRTSAYANLPKMPNPNSPAAIQLQTQIQTVAQQISDIDSQTSKISSQLAVAGQMKNGMYFTPGLTPLMAKVGQDANKLYDTGSMNLLYQNMFVRPVRMVNAIGDTWNNVMPHGWVKLDDPNSFREVDAQIAQSKAYTDPERGALVSQYIAAPYEGKRQFLYDLEAKTLARLANGNGLTEDAAKRIYSAFSDGRSNYISGVNLYGGATIKTSAGTDLNVSHLEDDGSLVATHPVFATQLENSHPMMDFAKMNTVLRNNGAAFQKLIDAGKSAQDAAEGITTGLRPGLAMQRSTDAYHSFTDLFNHLWKFQAHLRLGYGPRALSDDFLGQVTKLGAFNMAQRTAQGAYGQIARKAGNANTRWLYDATGYDAKAIGYRTGISQLEEDLATATKNKQAVQSYIPQSQKTAARQQQMLTFHQQGIDQIQGQLDGLKQASADLTNSRAKLTDKQIITPQGQVVPGFGEGAQGRMFLDMNSGRSTIDSALGGTASHTQGQIRGNPGWDVIQQTDPKHLGAWLRTVQHMIANDPAAMMAVKGSSADEIAQWFRGSGRQYYKSLVLDNMPPEQMADRIYAEVNHQLPATVSPEFGALREAVANGADDAAVAQAMKNTQEAWRPVVSGERTAYGLGKGSTIQLIDKTISKWYKVMAETPANVLSRNPLAATLYRGHVQDMLKVAEDQGLGALTNDHLNQIAESARKLTVNDVKKFTYNMDFETKITHATRFVAPFFGPMQEAFNRWGRILADKPETLGRAEALYTSPVRAGNAYTNDGRPINDGYTIDPATGNKVLVPKNEIYIRFQMPDYMAKVLGAESGSMEQIPLNSLNIAMQNDPWYNPGAGPLVQMAANHFAMKSDPAVGDFFQKVGILPTGVAAHDSDLIMGGVYKSLQKSNDQNTTAGLAIQAMAEEDYKYRNGLRSTPPTLAEVTDRAQHMTLLKALFSGTTVLPFSSSVLDPYQFYRDQYTTMKAANPATADQNFYAKYGDSAYGFTASLNKNNIPGIPATQAGQRVANQYKDLIAQDPALAGIIIGDQGGGNFSNTAYQQQVASGQRVKMNATDAWDKNRANLGWDQYTNFMNGVNAQLFQRGLRTLNDKGAADLLAQKKGFVQSLSSVYMPDGVTPNAYYNQQWTQAYNAVDPSKNDARALALASIATAKELQGRPDIQSLQSYLSLRASVKQELATRAGDMVKKSYKSAQTSTSGDINAKSNEDLKAMFQNGVMSLIEGNTYFQTLHDKYLSKDMFDHYDGTGMVNSVTGQA